MPAGTRMDLLTYSRLLAQELRTAGVAERQVQEVVGEVRDHVTATGDDPTEAFGTPAAYAAQWGRPIGWRRWAVGLLMTSAGAVGVAALVVVGVEAVLGEASQVRLADLIITALMLMPALSWMPLTVDLWVGRQAARGRPVSRLPWALLALVPMVAVVMGVTYLAGDPAADRDSSATLPWTVVVVLGVLLAPMLVFAPRVGQRTLPDEPGRPRPRWKDALRLP